VGVLEALDWKAPIVLLELGLLVALGSLVAEAVRRRRALLRPRNVLALALLLVVAAGARWVAPWATYDPEFRSTAMFLGRGAWTRYGFGMPAVELLARDVLRLPATFGTLFAAGFFSGVVAVPLLAAWARDAGSTRTAAVTAGLLLALDPAHVRFSPTDLPNTHEIALTLLALVLWTRQLRAPTPIGGAAAGVVLGTAVNLRPEALVVPPVVLAVAAAAVGEAAGASLRRRDTWAGLVLLAVFALPQVLVVAAHAVTDVAHYTGGATAGGGVNHGLATTGWRHLYALDPAWTPPLLGLLGLLGLVLGPRRRLVALLAVATLGFCALVPGGEWTPAGATWFAYVRHQVRAAPWLAALAAAGVDALARRSPVAGGIAALLAIGARAAWLPLAYVPSTVQEELVFLLAHLDEVPRGCTVETVASEQDGPLYVPDYLLRLRPDVRVVRVDQDEVPPPAAGCRLWYHAGACSLSEFRPRGEPLPSRCARYEATHALRPVTTTELDAHTWIGEAYLGPRVPVGWYAVVPR
jgi:hypothetical protein